jgi:hypothetical protein
VIWLAALLAGLGAGVWLLPAAHLGRIKQLAVISPTLLAGIALILFAWAVPEASQTLHKLSFGVGGTKATLQLAFLMAVLFGHTARILGRVGWARRLTQVICTGAGIAGFVLMFPLLGGLAIACASLAAGSALALCQLRLAPAVV